MNNDNTLEVMGQGVQTTAMVAAALIDLLSAIVSQSWNNANISGVDPTDSAKSAKLLLEHLKRGGELKSDSVDPKDAEIMRNLLRAYNVPFTSINIKDEKGLDRVVFLTRDIDSEKVSKVREHFLYEMRVGLGEMEINEFLKHNEGLNINAVTGLTDEEVEIFRHHIAKEDITYSIQKDETGNKVWFAIRDEQSVKTALLRTGYDLSGPDGAKYRQSIGQDLYNREVFDKSIIPGKGETLFVVDMRNPGDFISVTDHGFAKHSLKLDTQKDFAGNDIEVIRDANSIVYTSYDRDRLMDLAQTMYHPVILTAEEMSFIRNIGKQGELSYVSNIDEFKKAFTEVKEAVSQRTDYYAPVKVKEMLPSIDKVYSLVNLPMEATEKIKDLRLDDVAVVNDTVAFTDKDKDKINSVLSQTVYKDLDPIKAIEAKFFYEGRGRLDLTNPDHTQYIVNADFTGYVFKLDEKGLTIFDTEHANKEPQLLERGTKTFEELGLSMLRSMQVPVVLSKEEYEQAPEDRIKVITDRLPQNQAVDARAFVFNSTQREVEQLIDPSFNEEQAKPRQKEAMQYVDKLPKQTYMVDRTLMEKIADQTTSKKMVDTHSYQNKEVSANTSPDIDR